MGLLTPEEYKETIKLALPLFEEGQRRALLHGIPRGWVAALPIPSAPLFQLMSDLRALDETRVLADGSIPLTVWLRNLVDLLEVAQMQEAAGARRIRDAVGGRLQGGPALVQPLPRSGDEIVILARDYLAPSFFAEATSRVRAVARLVVPRYFSGELAVDAKGNAQPGSGTGWLLAPGLLLTNLHVVQARGSEEDDCDDADLARQISGTVARFDEDGEGKPTTERTIVELVASDPGLDFALLRIDRVEPERGFFSEAKRAVAGQAANIIHHPLGQVKQLAVRNNQIHSVETTTIQYFTCTEAGSSGAPVCDDQWQVVGLHRRWQSVHGVRFQGRDTLYVNEGSTLSAIRAALVERGVWAQVQMARGG